MTTATSIYIFQVNASVIYFLHMVGLLVMLKSLTLTYRNNTELNLSMDNSRLVMMQKW